MRNRLFALLIKFVLFGILLCILISSYGFIFNKRTSGDITWDTFYKQKDKTIDILGFGNSHIGNGLDLNIINAKTNAKMYNVYSSGQILSQTYYSFKETLNYQKPKLIIIESFSISSDKIYFLEKNPIDVDSLPFYSKIQSFDSKKIGFAKYEEFKDLYKTDNVISTFFPLIRNHSKWSEPDKIKANIENELNSKSDSKYYFGSSNTIWCLSDRAAKEYETAVFENFKFTVSESQEYYFDKIVKLARDNDIKVLVITTPFFKTYRNKIDYSSINNAIKNLTSRYKINYLDFNEVYPNLDYHYFANDKVGNNQHLNYKGAIKISTYLADFINKKYAFEYKNLNNELLESYIYNKKIKDTFLDGTKLIGNLEKLNGKGTNNLIIPQVKKHITLYGWMAVENKESKDDEMFVALLNEDNSFYYITKPEQFKPVERKDVSKYFKKEKLYNKSGFKFTIKSELLEKGNYKIYFAIRNNIGDVVFKNMYKKIQVI